MTISGFRDSSNALNTKTAPATVNPAGRYKNGIDTIAHTTAQLVASDLVESSSTTTIINATAHNALPGDVIIFTSGNLDKQFAHVFSITPNTITLCQILSQAPATNDGFDILRFSFARVNASGGFAIDTTGLATAPNQVLEIAQLTAIAGKDFATQTTLAALNTKIPASPSAEHTTAASPNASRLSDGISFYNALTDAQLRATPIAATTTSTPASLTAAAPTVASVGVASAQILASAPYRRIELINNSSNTISIGIGNAAVLSSGITIIGLGSSATIDGPITAAINAIASVAASGLAIQAYT